MPGKHALIIGNSHYEDPTLAKLKAPEADVRGLAELLRDSAIGQFESVRTVIDESEAITRRAIAGFFAQGKPEELLLLYFSGHGVLDDKGRLYLAAKDTQRDLPQATAIPAAFITDGMDSSRSRRQVLILDCCHSGAFARGARSATGAKAITESTFEGVVGYGRAVLTATDATQYAWEGEAVIGAAENSVFTHHMIEGLRSGAADTDGDGDITLEELYDYIYSHVVKQTPKQTPRKWSYNQEGEFIIARNPKPPPPKITPLPLELQQSIDDPRTWVREGAVAELSRLLSGSQPGLSAAAYAALQRLTGDDSRRVAEAANKTLAAWTGEATHQHPPAEPTKDSTQRAAEAGERERLAREKAEAEEEVRRENERLVVQRAAAEEAARLERERAAYEAAAQLVSQPALDRAATSRAVSNPLAVWMDKPWFPLAALTLGWGAALFSAIFVYWLLTSSDPTLGGLAYWLVMSLIGGTATWFALRASTSNERDVPPLLIIGLWVLAALFGSLLNPLFESTIGIDESVATRMAVFGAVGGIGTSAVLYRKRIVNRQRAVMIAGGWAIAWLVGAWLALSLLNLFGSDVPSGIYNSLRNLGLGYDIAVMLIPWVEALIKGLTGALAGFIGGRVMLGELTSNRAEPGVQSKQPVDALRQSEAVRREHDQSNTGAKGLVAAIPGLAAWLEKPWFPLAALTVGWALAFFSGTATFWTLYANNALDTSRFGELLVVGLIGGTATWLSLRASLPRDPPLPAPFIIGVGVVIALAGTVIYPALESSGVGTDESVALERAILGTLGGLAIGALLYQRRTLKARRAILIAAGWAIGWSVAAWLGLTVYNLFGDDPSSGIKEALQPVMTDDLAHALVPWVDALIRGLIGALAGFIGGWVMVRQLRESKPHDA